MTSRRDVSIIHNSWNDAQKVSKQDMDVEQNHNVSNTASTIQNHFGSGVLLETPEQTIIFDSDKLTLTQAEILAAGNFDGQGLEAHSQPADINLGNQLEVELSGSTPMGRLSVKVAIVGLSFDNTLQMDKFYFYKNEKQTTSKHYKSILGIFFNDFKGNTNCSRTLGGRVVIRQASSFQLSRDAIMEAQDVEPDLFWRDFKVYDTSIALFDVIQNGIGSTYSVDALSINITEKVIRTIAADDVTTKIGQKFRAHTDNIQKITLLLGVELDGYAATEAEQYDWLGDIVVNVYALQTTTNCPTDIVPGLAIEFDPSSEPLVQLSFNQTTLEAGGYVLNNVLQPVDFVFSSTKLGSGVTSTITEGNFYAVSINRSGAATNGLILVGVGNDRVENSRLTLFSGLWTDVVEEDLWFQVWTDAGMVADGRGYDNGNGMQYEKTALDPDTAATIDNQIVNKSFIDTGEANLNIGILLATEEESVTEQDERTGNNVFSRKMFVPAFEFNTEAEIATKRENIDPIVIGCAEDINPKQNASLEKSQILPGMALGDQFCVVNPDADLLSLMLEGSTLIPNVTCAQDTFLIVKTEICTDGYGDVNGDGYIDDDDISAVSGLIGEGLALDSTQQKIIDGYFTTLELLRADVDGDGYVTAADVTLITQFVNKTINAFPVGASFQHVCFTLQQSTGRYDGYYDCDDGYVRLDGYTGLNIVGQDTLSDPQAKFTGQLGNPVVETDTTFITVPFPGVTYQITPRDYWQQHLLVFSSDARVVPASFCSPDSIVQQSCATPLLFECSDRSDITPICDPGRNDFYIPDNLIIDKGSIIRPDGSAFAFDFEIGTVILQLPDTPLSEVSLNMFDKLVADRGDGFTRGSLTAMRYADCTTVQDEDLSLNRIRFSVSVQSFIPQLDGYDSVDGYGIIVDDIIGVHVDQTTGILKLSLKDLFVDQVLQTLITKIQIQVFLKKSGWVNQVVTIAPEEIAGLLST